MNVDTRKIGCVAVVALVIAVGEKRIANPSPLNVTGSLQLAQADVSLTERANFIGTCRGSGATALTLYEDSRKTKPVGSVPAGISVTLTGVVGSGVVLIRNPSVGWIESATLTTDCSGGGGDSGGPPLPPDIDTNPAYCRRLRSSAVDGPDFRDLDRGLPAFDRPGGALQTAFGTADGPSGGAVVRVTQTPPELQNYDARTWIRVRYNSQLGTRRVGWISNGPIGSYRSVGFCLPGQN